MPILNPSFETVGASAGTAASWAEYSPAGASDICAFGSYPYPYEMFGELWNNNQLAQSEFDESTDLTPALFELLSLSYECFDFSWVAPHAAHTPPLYNHQGLSEFYEESFARAMFDSAADAEEDFDSSWDNNQTAQSAFTVTDLTVCYFGPHPIVHPPYNEKEGFEGAWWGNEGYQTSFGPGDIVACTFDTFDVVEGFDGTWTTTFPL